MSRRILSFYLCLQICLGLGTGWAEESTPPLPKAMGAINDYAAVLGKESRQQLQSWIDELKTKEKITVYLLITLLDPYNDPPTFADQIWESWKLPQEQAVFLLLVKEADHWVFHWKSTVDLAPRFPDASAGEEYSRSIQELLEERRVGTAAIQAVEHLRELLIVPKIPEPEPGSQDPQPSPPSASQTSPVSFAGSSLFWYVLGGAVGIGTIMGLIWLAFVWLCPSCGGRLSRRSRQPFHSFHAATLRRRTRERVYYCQRCGYVRVRRRER